MIKIRTSKEFRQRYYQAFKLDFYFKKCMEYSVKGNFLKWKWTLDNIERMIKIDMDKEDEYKLLESREVTLREIIYSIADKHKKSSKSQHKSKKRKK